jgi:tetratricopeptide (TPR) repeat protein
VLVSGDAGIGKTRLASELATRASAGGFEVLVGRCLDLVGAELPYQPFVEALRPLEAAHDEQRPGSQLRVFEDTLAALANRAAVAPVLLVLEDLHWADTSTLDLVVFLAHNLDEHRVLLLATYRPDELSSAERVRRLADGVRHSGSALVLELGPLERDELTALLDARAETPPSQALTDAIVARSEGNPFFAEELLAAAGAESGTLPRALRDLLLQRVARLDRRTQGVLRLAAAAGRDVAYPLLRAAAELPERDVRESLRRAVEHTVLVSDQATGSFRFRHALLAEAIYATLLPGEREEVHGRLAEQLARGEPPAPPAELAPHWEAAGRAAEALVASIQAARDAEAALGLAEALAHLERALRVWAAVADPERLTNLDLAELCAWTARLASQTGAAPRAVELAQRAIDLVGDGDPLRSALLHERLGTYLWWSGDRDAGLAERERAVELVPPEPPSAERAVVLAALGNALMTAWRHDESRAVCEQALALVRTVDASEAEFRALAVLGVDLAYLGRAEEGLATLELALRLAEENGAPQQLYLAYAFLTDVLTMLGRPRESARLAATGIDALRPYGHDDIAVVANRIEALAAIGEWDEADALSAAAGRASAAFFAPERLNPRAYVEIGRGRFESAREHLEAVRPKLTTAISHKDELYDRLEAELALWERRWPDADRIVRDGLARARSSEAAFVRVQLCAQGLRAQAEIAALARARRDDEAVRVQLAEARKLIGAARWAAAAAAEVTPNAAGWGAQAEAEYTRACGQPRAEAWAGAAAAWDTLERPPLAAYCRWRQAEALVAGGALRTDTIVPLKEAHTVAARIGARPLVRELEVLAELARLDLAPLDTEPRPAKQGVEEVLGPTPREPRR